MEPGGPVDGATRAAVLAAYDLERLRYSPALTRITDFAAALCGTPVALVTVLEETEQRFLSRTGVDMDGTPRAISFCEHTILGTEPLVVPDMTADPRFAGNPLVTGAPHVRFYAGVPLITDEGVALGSLCVIDMVPHPDGLSPLQLQGLETLAENVIARLRDTRDAAAWRHAETDARRALGESESRFHTLADTMPQMVWSTLPDGYHDYYNARWYEFTGMPEGSTDGESWRGVFHPEDQERASALWARSLATGEPYQIEYRLRHRDGEYRWVLGRALPIRDEAGRITRWFGTCTDVHEQKIAGDEREVIAQELSHRIKNIFSVIAGLIGFAARGKPELRPAAADLRDRIAALGRAHDFVRPHSRNSAPKVRQDSLLGLLGELFAPYARDGGGGVTVTGDEVTVDDRSATPLALLFHELATNAAKYGALSSDTGRVVLDVRLTDERVILGWTETGGPPVTPPTSTGFGSQLVELSAVRQLGGTVERDWNPAGLRLTITVPADAFARR
ncbi:sensor histidine kinase [Sphingomonas sp.]|jgi:PAS domain S-box-containing protein|uniref:sensor histidine kinase n=1 Tax=Sphingomonas sp. TaxID=28214 RepID=UPI002D7F5B33|nr:PAS domain-containing protein [Sphingomonas sp.]HEU0045382.1 PAS domain-containing protein [Sphingomonas sp.]